MTMSRRAALGGATALAATGSAVSSVFAAVARQALIRGSSTAAASSAQRFLELLVHPDEAGGKAYSTMIWISGPDTAWYAASSLDETKYRMTNSGYKKRGYRLRRVSAFNTHAGIRYAGVWERTTGPDWHSRHGMTRKDFERACAEFAGSGYRLTHLDARIGFAAIWEKGDANVQRVLTGLSGADYNTQSAALVGQGYRPLRISGGTVNGASRFTALFEKDAGVPWRAHANLNDVQLRNMIPQMTAQGYRMVDASGHMVNGRPSLAGIWQKA